MVCISSGVGRAESWPAISGGFVLVPAADLMVAWAACRTNPLGIGEFRAWLAAHEMVARRAKAGLGRSPCYGPAELARLCGVSERTAGASIRRLAKAGLIEWTGAAIVFPSRIDAAENLILDSIGAGRGSVIIPRRMLRHLARFGSASLIATVLGLLLRCLSRRRDGFRAWGRIKASWITRAFGVSDRRVKSARRALITLGWAAPEPSGQAAENRWGRAYRIDLAWKATRPERRRSSPPPADPTTPIVTPSVDPDPLPERNKNQEPAGCGPAGASLEGYSSNEYPRGDALGAPPLPAPRLDDVRPEDLADVGRTLELHRQAVGRKLADPSEAGRLRFLALAEHAMGVGKANPPGLFAALLRRGAWSFITQVEEDGARRRLRAHQHGRPASRVTPMTLGRSAEDAPAWSSPGLSDDARLVREIRGAIIRAGIYRDPWPAFRARNPGWDRGRWDAALCELGLA